MDARILGVGMTTFGRHLKRSHSDLAAEAVKAAMEDAGLDDGTAVESIAFGSCAMYAFGQPTIAGQVTLRPLVEEGYLETATPVVNLENACVTGTSVFQHALATVESGQADLALAVGVDKTFLNDISKVKPLFEGAFDRFDTTWWDSLYRQQALEHDLRYEPVPERITLLDVSALVASWHMQTYGTTVEQLAASSAKNHGHGALNPKAQHQKSMTVDEVLQDKPIVGPLTRSMCTPLSDGAAAAVICSARFLAGRQPQAQKRAVRVLASCAAGGGRRTLAEPSVAAHAAASAFARARCTPADVDVVELHDATSFGEIYFLEEMGFFPRGAAGAAIEDGQTRLDGPLPVNTSGGLVSKGHPLAATGLGMIHESVAQLRQEASERQTGAPNTALCHNAGGMMGFDEATACVTLLGAPGAR